MQVLNFIPEDYLRKKLIRKANLLCALLAVTVILVLSVLLAVLGLARERLDERNARVENEVRQGALKVRQWETFQTEKEAKLLEARRATQLLAPLPRSRVLAEVVTLLPGRTSLTELTICDETVTVIEKPAGRKADRTSKKRAGHKKLSTREKQQTHLRVRGLAPTDVEVARLIAALSNSSFFGQVELSYSDDQPAAGEQVLRRFEISMKLSENAYRLSRMTVEEAELS